MDFNLKEIEDFVFYENHLLDSKNYDDWYDLFSEDGIYWVPGCSDQTDQLSQMSIALENKLLLKLRIERLNHSRAFSLQPKIRGTRLVQPIKTLKDKMDSEGYVQVETNIIYSEFQSSSVEIFPAKVTYHLKPKDTSWEITQKRIDLLAVDGYLPMIQLFI